MKTLIKKTLKNTKSLTLLSKFNFLSTFKKGSTAPKVNFSLFSHEFTFKKFSTGTQGVYLSEDESYLMNEHDNIINQLDSQSYPRKSVPEVILELTKICISLDRFRLHLKGIEYIANFLNDHLQDTSEEDFNIYLQAFTIFQVNNDEIPIHDKFVEEILRRYEDEVTVMLGDLNTLSVLGISQRASSEVIEKIRGYELTDLDLVLAVNLANSIKLDASDPFWGELTDRMKKIQLTDFDVEFMADLANAVRIVETAQRTNLPVSQQVKNYIEKNIEDIPIRNMDVLAENYKKMAQLDAEQTTKLVIQVYRRLGMAHTADRLNFYLLLLSWCHEDPELISNLTANRDMLPNGLVVPTKELVVELQEFKNKIENASHKNTMEINEEFWFNFAEKIGFNPQFCRDFYLNGKNSRDYVSTLMKEIDAEHGEEFAGEHH